MHGCVHTGSGMDACNVLTNAAISLPVAVALPSVLPFVNNLFIMTHTIHHTSYVFISYHIIWYDCNSMAMSYMLNFFLPAAGAAPSVAVGDATANSAAMAAGSVLSSAPTATSNAGPAVCAFRPPFFKPPYCYYCVTGTMPRWNPRSSMCMHAWWTIGGTFLGAAESDDGVAIYSRCLYIQSIHMVMIMIICIVHKVTSTSTIQSAVYTSG